jgi:hypothetical protein
MPAWLEFNSWVYCDWCLSCQAGIAFLGKGLGTLHLQGVYVHGEVLDEKEV